MRRGILQVEKTQQQRSTCSLITADTGAGTSTSTGTSDTGTSSSTS
jgi:hypothetical protein